jgi:ATP-dependent Lon protease
MRRLPLFPLPLVLYPGAPLPLHIFEPRYRQMMAHCLEGDRRFGLLYHDPDRSGPFAMEAGRVGCVAEILQFQPLPDGRSNLLSRGVERFRLEDGIESDSLYFEGLVEEYPDATEPDGTEGERGARALELFGQVLERIAEDPQPLPPLDPGEPVSFQLAQWIRIDPPWQQALLELRGETERLERIEELLQALLQNPP